MQMGVVKRVCFCQEVQVEGGGETKGVGIGIRVTRRKPLISHVEECQVSLILISNKIARNHFGIFIKSSS